jgi:hypothetical protein
LHAAAETALYADIGKCDCFVEGIGYLGPTMGGEETVAKFVQANLFTAWAHNSIGFLWWLGFDCADRKRELAPYDWCEVERELGLIDKNGNLKKVGCGICGIYKFLKEISLSRIAAKKEKCDMFTQSE